MNRNDVRALIDERLNGIMTPEQHQRLDEVLRTSAEARRQWFLACDIETGLADWAVAQDQLKQNQIPKASTTSSARPSTRRIMSVAAIAALVLLALGFSFLRRGPAPLDPMTTADQDATEIAMEDVAVVTRTLGARWHADSPFHTGSLLAKSTLKLQSGAALIEFFSGAGIVLEGPAELEIVSKNRANLLKGKLNAVVPPHAQGFTILTRDGEIVDQGTEFGVVLVDDAPSELHVFTGLVEIKTDTETVELQTGEAVNLGTADATVFDADRSAFLSEQSLIEQSKLEAARMLERWRQDSLRLSADPATLCHLRFDTLATGESSPRQIVDSAERGHPARDARVIGSEWVSGRWDKPALLLRNVGDRIRLNLPDAMKVVTLLSWVNVQSLNEWQNVLISSDSDRVGSLRWHLTKRGQLRLQIARDLGGSQNDWEAVESRPFLDDSRQRSWMLLATTFDGKTIRHYADGELVGEGASFTPESLHLGTCEIGNWSGKTRRNLHAVLDEFVVLDRVLSPSEITEIYRFGSPRNSR